MKINTVKGTNDYLPQEVELRDYLQTVILETYTSNGFQRISTPIIEDIDNLDKSDGGDNLNLIFKILKRGDKLEKVLQEKQYDAISDLGLRYDLTLPLSRYYANNRAKLILPFKCIQIDKVYRAERPQKGRLREFVQCDIDIIGTNSKYAEIELIHTTSKALLALNITGFKVKINDRRMLKNILLGFGFIESQLDNVCIIFDKLDKIGIDGIRTELTAKEFGAESIDNLIKLLESTPIDIETLRNLCTEKEIVSELQSIINLVTTLANGQYTVLFDISLVRGQGYYTGLVYEIECPEFRGAIAGGGRYDNLIGKFLGESVPAVGFSIGFERIFNILKEKGFDTPQNKKKLAILFDSDTFEDANSKADFYRFEYNVAIYEKPKKVSKFLSKLKEHGYYGFYICGQTTAITILE